MKDNLLKYKRNILVILLLSVIVYLYFILKNDSKLILNQIISIKTYYIILLFTLILLVLLLEGFTLHLFTKSKVKGIKFFDTFRLNLATHFFSAITPFASGGQPFQVFYYNARGIKTKDSSSIVLMNFITYNIAFSLFGMFCMVFKYYTFNELLNGKGYLLMIGFTVNLCVTMLTFFLAFSKRLYHYFIDVLWGKIVRFKLLERLKLETKTNRMKQTIDDFNKEMKELNKNRKLWFLSLCMNVLKIILFYSIPFIIFSSLGVKIDNVTNFIIGAFFIAMIMAYIPLPGASIGAEGSFNLIYLTLVNNKEVIISAMIIWRFITYYFITVLGAMACFSLSYKKNLEFLNYENENVLLNTNIRYNI